MANALVVTPGGYRPAEMVHKVGSDRQLRILTGRLQGVDASGAVTADYGSVPRDGSNPALTPGYALPPGVETPEGSEPGSSLGRGWIAFAHWRNDDSRAISSFRSVWTVPPEPETRSGQTLFLFLAMQDPIPMTLMPALQWGPSAAGGGDYWSVASWYVGGTTGAVFHGDLMPVNVGDEVTGFITLTERQRAHFDYQCGFAGLGDADIPVHGVRQLSRAGFVVAAYGVSHCSDYPASAATEFRAIEMLTGSRHPELAWQAADTVTDCGQHAVIRSDVNPGGEVTVHYCQQEASLPRSTSAKTSTSAEKRASRSGAKRAETAQTAAAEVRGDGAEELAAAVGELTVAGALEDVAAVELAAGVADLTHTADAAIVADRMGILSEVVAGAGEIDIAQAIHLLSTSEDVAVMSAIVGVMSEGDLEHGLQLARLAGELRAAGETVSLLEMPVLAGFLDSRGDKVNGMAVNSVLRSTSSRALAVAMQATGADLASLSAENVVDGIARRAAADALAIRSGELAAASVTGAERGLEELATSAVYDQTARELTAAATTDAVVGGAKVGAAAAGDARAEGK